MKNTAIVFLLAFFVFMAGGAFGDNGETGSFDRKQKKVMSKFIDDEISYRQFAYFGRVHCLESFYGSGSIGFVSLYASAYNRLFPLPRIVRASSAREFFDDLLLSEGVDAIFDGVEWSDFFDSIKFCSDFYSDHDRVFKYYNKLILDEDNYYNDGEDHMDIESYYDDYLDGFFIEFPGVG